MRLRTVEVDHWACIESLTLADLHDGVIVLHGPNGTGKSQLVQAIRSGLFDHFHDSQDKIIRQAVPWTTRAAPRVAVEFEHDGKRYRIDKTFSRTGEGQAVLELLGGPQRQVLARGKEATPRVRQLLGMEPTAKGVYSQKAIFQMLWLEQQDIRLPEKLDNHLKLALESILGAMVTGRDADFKHRLDEACKRWFTETMRDQKDSPVRSLKTKWEGARKQLEEINKDLKKAEKELHEYQQALAQQSELTRQRKQAKEEADDLKRQWQEIQRRSDLFQQKVELQKHCRQQLEHAEQKRDDFDKQQKQLDHNRRQLEQLLSEREKLQRQLAAAKQAAAKAQALLEEAKQRLQLHNDARPRLHERQQLMVLHEQIAALQEKLEQVEKWDQCRQELEQSLCGVKVFTEEEIQSLRDNRRRAADCRAKLEAGEFRIRVRALRDIEVAVAADRGEASRTPINNAEEQSWQARQRAEIRLGDSAGDWAVIEVGRGQEEHRLEVLAEELADLDATYRMAAAAAGEDPDDAATLDRLAARRLQHDQSAKELHWLQRELHQAAPDGILALSEKLLQRKRDQEAQLSRCPELRDWTPQQTDYARRLNEFNAMEKKLQSEVSDAQKTFERHDQAVKEAAEKEQQLARKIAELEGQVKTLNQMLAAKDRTQLEAAVAEAQKQLDTASKQVQEYTLSDADREVEKRYQAAVAAQEQCDEACRRNEDRLLELKTLLANSDGLHTKRIQAEQEVHEYQEAWKREHRRAEACKLLKERFEKVREDQTCNIAAPINDRVMKWARHLGLAAYSGLSIGSELLPDGLVRAGSDAELIPLDSESHGTVEQLSLLIRLAIGGLLASNQLTVAILDDPLAHADIDRHRRMQEIIQQAAAGDATAAYPAGPLQILILTCHPELFDCLTGAQRFDLVKLIRRTAPR